MDFYSIIIDMKRLSDIKPGDSGFVKQIGSSGALRRRIIDMGITPGVEIKLVKSAPLGDPIEISLRGYNLSLRNTEARQIVLSSEPTNSQEEKAKQNTQTPKKQMVNIPPNKQSGEIIKAALIGNPNSGKTTLFNHLTNSYQYVGNWPGVTVERKEGRINNSDLQIDLVDLPGIYSLSPYSPEEIITRNYILKERPDVIINILDATNLERNLYLTTQLLELDCKIILALNMADLLSRKGKIIDYIKLEEELGVPVIPISAKREQGLDNLLNKTSTLTLSKNATLRPRNLYSEPVENALDEIGKNINTEKINRFNLIKIFEDDPLTLEELHLPKDKLENINKIRDKIKTPYDKDKESKKSCAMIIADERYNYIVSLRKKYVKNIYDTDKKKKTTFSSKLDYIITGKYTALPIFLIIILSIFFVAFGPIGTFLKDFCENFINTNMSYSIEQVLNYLKASSWVKSLVLDAIIRGVGAVVAFLPQIILLFASLSFLEGCGYMSRAAFIMDKLFRKIGLSGRAFVPLIMGFGCSVPAILGTRILENKKDKNLTIFLIPFMSCSAKMPIYLLFASTFFPRHQMFVILSLYLIGIATAIITALLFKNSLFKGDASPFLMEMPEYKLPSVKSIWSQVWNNIKDFIEKAGTVILAATIIIWFLQSFSFDFKMVTDNSQSILAGLGSFIAPVFSICGFGDWRSCVALLTGVLSKESIVSTMAVLYNPESAQNLSQVILSAFSLPAAISFIIFVLLYTPCVAALSAMHKEFGSWKLTLTSVMYQLFVAFFASALIFQILTLFSNIFG